MREQKIQMGTFVLLAAILLAGRGAIDASESGAQNGENHFSKSCSRCHDDDAEGDGPHHSDGQFYSAGDAVAVFTASSVGLSLGGLIGWAAAVFMRLGKTMD